jgi:signal transduction histidine kinase
MVDYPDGRFVIPIEHELQERLAWFIGLRWLTAGGILLGALAARWIVPENISLTPLYLMGLAVFIYNIPFRFYFVQAKRLSKPIGKNFVYLQIGLDWLTLSIVVHYTGGIQSPVTLAFTLHLIIGAILLRTRTCYVLAIIASSLIGVLTMLETREIWTLSYSSRFFADPLHGINSPLNLWIANSVFFIIIAKLATSITQRLREKEVTLFNSAKALDRAYREMEALYKIGQVINSTLEMKEVLSLIAENATKLMTMKACFIRLFDRSGKKLYIGGAYGLGQAYINTRPRDFDKSPIDKETIATGVVQVLEVGDETRFEYHEDAKREGLRSVLCVPIESKNKVIGVIRVYSAEPHHFSEQEQNLLKNFANLGALAIDNARSYAEIKTLSEERVWFTRMTHHHLRAPLAVMQSMLDALPYAGPLTEKQKELLSRVSKRIHDALDLIRDLLDLAGAQRFIEGEAEKVLLCQALEKTLELTRERARSKNIEMDVRIPSPDVAIHVQASDIERIFTNFLDNAVKYTPPGGRVSLTITSDESAVRVEVADTGIGIDPRDHARIFEGFYRTPAAKATSEMGTGLGLSIVRRLLDRCHAKLELHSAIGQGSRFIVTFPLND